MILLSRSEIQKATRLAKSVLSQDIPSMKGLVEGLVKFARLNFLVPVPQVRDFDELNTHLLQMCREDMRRKLRGHSKSKEELLLE